jgi:hypothetical protein
LKIRIDKRDTVFSKLIRLRARFNCELRGKCSGQYFPMGHGLQCCHIFSRRHQATRYDPDNAMAGCFACHQYFGENPTLFTAVVKKHLGDVRYEELEQRHRKIVKRTKADAEALYRHLKEQLAALQADPNHSVVAYD